MDIDRAPADSAALVPYTGADAAATRAATVNARAELARRRLALEQQQEQARADLDQQRKELEAAFAKQRAELEAQMRPLKAQLKKMTEVLWTVDLYLGRDETLRLIREGAPAPADTPLTIRQKVLVMAEESLILMDEKADGMNADDVPKFIDWLCADDAHLDQVLPEPKGVVVLIPTRVASRAANMFEQAARDAENSRSYWLIRNGERLYLLTVDPELQIQDRVLPRRREFVEVFDKRLFGFGGRNEPVKPGSDEWMKLEELADAKRRHYMRVLLILQGLIDRTPALHPLPPSGLNLMSLADQDSGKIQLIQDDDPSNQLGTGAESFRDFQRRLNGLLRPGLRVIGNWYTSDFTDLRYERGGHPRLFPNRVESRPETNTPHLIDGRKDGGFVIRFDRTDKVYKRNQPVPGRPGYVYLGETAVEAARRASCVVMPDDTWVLPFDLVTVAELERFLRSRDDRSEHFLSMVPTIRAAIAAKRAEAEQEADFRDLIGRLLIMDGAETDGIEALVDELVHWWKLAHTWTKPLNGTGEHEKKAADQILTEHRSRRAAAADTSEETVIAAGRALPGVIAVARDRQGNWAAYAPSPDAHESGVFLDVTRIRRNGTTGATKTWQALPQRTASALYVGWAADEWSEWRFGINARHRLTEPERQALISDLLGRASGSAICVTEMWDPKEPAVRKLELWQWTRSEAPEALETRAEHDPFGWRAGEHSPVQSMVATVERDGARPTLTNVYKSSSGGFGRFSSRSRWGDTPWWPDDAHQHDDARPRLVWADELMLDATSAYRARCAVAATAEREAGLAKRVRAVAYERAIRAELEAKQLTEVRARFDEDFGAGADDLWPAHLKSLTLPDPTGHVRVFELLDAALKRGVDVDGMTLDLVADAVHAHEMARYRNRGDQHMWKPLRQPTGDLGSVVVPVLPDAESNS